MRRLLALGAVQGLLLLGLAACENPLIPKQAPPDPRLEAAKKLMVEAKYEEAETALQALIRAEGTSKLADEARKQHTANRAKLSERRSEQVAKKLAVVVRIPDVVADPTQYQGKRVRVTGAIRHHSSYWKQHWGFQLEGGGQMVDVRATTAGVRSLVKSRKDGARMTVEGYLVPQDDGGVSSQIYISVDDAK